MISRTIYLHCKPPPILQRYGDNSLDEITNIYKKFRRNAISEIEIIQQRDARGGARQVLDVEVRADGGYWHQLQTDLAKVSERLDVKCRMLETECEILGEELRAKEQQGIDGMKFYAGTMTTEEVAKFHRVSTVRVQDYAHRWFIPQHSNSTDGKMLFRVSEVLKLNFDELRKAKKILTR